MNRNNLIQRAIDKFQNEFWKGVIIKNIGLDLILPQKKALICYLDWFQTSKKIDDMVTHTNQQEFFQIIKTFLDLGYSVDVCSCDYQFKKTDQIENRYDLIFGFGTAFFSSLAVNPQAYSVLYLTENPFEVSYVREKERIDYLYQRKGIRIKQLRTGKYYKPDDTKRSDCVVSLGDPKLIDAAGKPVYALLPSAFHNPDFNETRLHRNKLHFLALSSLGFVHKGFDLVLEVFSKHPEWTLYYCGPSLIKSARKIHEPIPNNVIDCGFIDIHSQRFLDLVYDCTAIVQFSCSEGTSTSILTGMSHGLIPIVSSGCNCEQFGSLCYIAEGYKLNEIENTLLKYTDTPIEELEKKSKALMEFSKENASLDSFSQHFNEIMKMIVQSNN